ncbi:MAG: DUF58 domain-containing protein [Fimbriimonas ginsengisoli]|uniref:DUF58 domain-containing protein n=1 Tax=Fimbriimonas ginsengisoli TaxID=1005039 RepID=A0A931PUR4_FIMGI|nr:DUF58 domain-containing protein [Fimbriimonas ginsengisoli]
MIPTRRFWLAIGIGIPIGAVAAQLGSPYLMLAYDGALILAAWATYLLAPTGKDLIVRRKFDPVLSARVANRITLSLENDGGASVSLIVRDEPPPDFKVDGNERDVRLAPGKQQDFSYWVTPIERGGDFFRGTFLRVRCPLGLAFKQIRLPTEQPVRVYPNVLALREFELLKQQGRLKEIGIRRSRSRGLGTEFESLREYAEGDDFRKIDWKASARKGKLVVRQYEQERNQAVMIVVDVGRHMLAEADGVRKIDRAVDACLMLTHAAVSSGDNVGLLVYGDMVRRYIPPRKGRSQEGFVLEAVHDLLAEPIESDPIRAMAYLGSRWKRRSLLVLFTDLEDADRAKTLTAAFGPLARRHLALIARVSDPKLKEAFDAPLEDLPALYKRAAADMLLADRRMASLVLNTAGIHNLEAEPDELSASLVSFYFAVKERALI